MGTDSIIKHLLSDDKSLSLYFEGSKVTFEDIKRRLFLLERGCNTFIADHHYRLFAENSFVNINSIADILSIGIVNIAERHLTLTENRINVIEQKQHDWQEVITKITPLVLQTAYLTKIRPIKNDKNIDDYFNKFILPNFRFTALPYPLINELNSFIKANNGFYDLHIHLNGSTETDVAWQDFIKTPNLVFKNLNKGFRNNLVKEQLEQESYLTNPNKFKELLLIARRIRNYLHILLYPSSYTSKELSCIIPLEKKLQKITLGEITILETVKNPFSKQLVNQENAEMHPMAIEGLMYVLIFEYLSNNKNPLVASLFHYYLLILGLANRLLVQQTHQNGFEQFQKNTANDLRSHSEKTYEKRFKQLHGNEFQNICFMEGRFSPKDSKIENIVVLKSINEGWLKLIKTQEKLYPENRLPQLNLIAHFIKCKDKYPNWQIRHKDLRKSLWKKAMVLSIMFSKKDMHVNRVVGIDAAASEFDTPPEVFSPSFRMLRRTNKSLKFTYHAGEDFYHIISGLRAIYETIEYLDMSSGDRIGHAVACGIEPKYWSENIKDKILIRKGEYLDNLIFVCHIINNYLQKNNNGCLLPIVCKSKDIKHKSLSKSLEHIQNKIKLLSNEIYLKDYSIDDLINSWLFRKYCPILMLSETKEIAMCNSVFNENEWQMINTLIPNRKTDIRVEIMGKYHNIDYRKNYDSIIEINVTDLIDITGIKDLQLFILKYLTNKGIIIETLPTSNVRIGMHHNFKTYHFSNWIDLKQKKESIPSIVVGTDDAGIFATNIYNEYANIYCHLKADTRFKTDDAISIIKELNQNSESAKFT